MIGNRITIAWILTVALLLLSGVAASAVAPAGFEQMIKPFLKKNCIRCHGEKKQKGKLALHDAPVDFANAKTSELWL